MLHGEVSESKITARCLPGGAPPSLPAREEGFVIPGPEHRKRSDSETRKDTMGYTERGNSRKGISFHPLTYCPSNTWSCFQIYKPHAYDSRGPQRKENWGIILT